MKSKIHGIEQSFYTSIRFSLYGLGPELMIWEQLWTLSAVAFRRDSDLRGSAT